MLEKMKQKDARKIETPDKKFEHKRSLGQNFLTSNVVPKWMTEAGEVKANDIVLEIGPGTGMLTRTLLETGAQIIAIEADSRAVSELEKTFATYISTGQLTLHHGDAREITPKTLGLKNQKFKVVANIPYYLSGFLLRNLLESEVQPNTLVFLIQKELAERIARSQKESLLSLSVKAFGKPKYFKTVSRGHFHPSPKVDSAILQIKDINQDQFKSITTEKFFELLHLGLGNKRKQLLSNLAKVYKREALETIFKKLNLKNTVRGEDLDLDTWLKLCPQLPQ